MPLKVGVIGTVGVPASYGGFETLVEHLIRSDWKKFGIEVYVACEKKSYPQRIETYCGASLFYVGLPANGSGSMFYDALSALKCARLGCDRILMLGVSGGLVAPLIRLMYPRIKLIVNIDGIEWRRAKWGFLARSALYFLEKVCMLFSTAIIVDNLALVPFVPKRFRSKIRVLTYGGDHIEQFSAPKSFVGDRCRALAICRIEPENNVEMILDAFSRLPRAELTFVGNWNNSEYGMALRSRYEENGNIRCLDPIYDQSSLAKLRHESDVYIHGHSAGGTNPSLVEAMYTRRPILCFDCEFNRVTTSGTALFFSNVDELIDSLSVAGRDAEEIGQTLFNFALENYKWSTVCEGYFQTIVGAGT